MNKHFFAGMATQAAIAGILDYLGIIKISAIQQLLAAGIFLIIFAVMQAYEA